MKLFDRILIFFATITVFVLLIFFTRSYYFSFIPLLGLLVVIFGGKIKHV